MKYIIFFILLAFQLSFAQQKYMIYFTNKGTEPNILSKTTEQYKSAVDELSDRSIERRKKTMGDEIITYEDIPVRTEYIDALEAAGVEVFNTLKWFNAVSAYIPAGKMEELLSYKFIRKIEEVRTLRSRKPDITASLKKALQDTLNYGTSYTQLNLSDIPVVHAKGITGKGVLLGVLDTGFRWKTHEALSHADVLAEYDFIFQDTITENQPPMDALSQHNHGTIVFSVISGLKDSVLIGAAYNAQFLLAKTEDIRSETRVEEDNYAAALEWMEAYGADITTSSLGYSEFDDFSYEYKDMDGRTTIVTRAAELAFARGVLTITSAGNEGAGSWFHITAPADGINTIAVGAVDNRNRVASFSSRGPSADGRIKPDITAMGVSVFGASIQDNAYGTASGTSLASPIAAGAAVLLLSAHPHLNNVQMRDIILRTADNFRTPDNEKGYGLISAKNAIEYPNLSLSTRDNKFRLRKTFIEDTPDEMYVYITTDKTSFTEYSMEKDSLGFYITLPFYNQHQKIYFYFAALGIPRIPPLSDFYAFTYGDLIIKRSGFPVNEYYLSNNYPNPFNNTTNISFNVPDVSDIELVIYDALGQKVRELYKASSITGEFTVRWDGRKDDGLYCSSGMYIYRLKYNTGEEARKMILLK
jgi:serine protease AprX